MQQLSRHARGFTLVEVMITVFVVAIGLLSAAALQAVSKKAAFDAVQRSSANTLAQDLIERMRGNRLELQRYAPGGTTREINAVTAGDLTAQICDKDTSCSSTQLAAHDLYEWWRGLEGAAEQLVEGSGSAAVRSAAGGLRSPTGCITRARESCRVEVAIAWRGTSLTTQGDASTPEDPTNNTCGQTSNADYEWNAESKQSYRRVLVVQANLGEGDPCP